MNDDTTNTTTADLAWWKQRAIDRYAAFRAVRADLERRDELIGRVFAYLKEQEAAGGCERGCTDDLHRILNGDLP